jgi:hypothetical protein
MVLSAGTAVGMPSTMTTYEFLHIDFDANLLKFLLQTAREHGQHFDVPASNARRRRWVDLELVTLKGIKRFTRCDLVCCCNDRLRRGGDGGHGANRGSSAKTKNLLLRLSLFRFQP